MNGALLQQKVWYGYKQSALRIGLPFQLYRPNGGGSPLVPGNLRGTMQASFNQDFAYSRGNKYGNPVWNGLFDGSLTLPGDYLVEVGGQARIFFIAGMQPLLPMLCVDCNRVLTISRAAVPNAVGAVGYGGDTAATETTLMTGFPASVLAAGRGSNSDVNLPGDLTDPWWMIKMPAVAGLQLNSRDIVTDDAGRKFTLAGPELTDLGWRIYAQQAQT